MVHHYRAVMAGGLSLTIWAAFSLWPFFQRDFQPWSVVKAFYSDFFPAKNSRTSARLAAT